MPYHLLWPPVTCSITPWVCCGPSWWAAFAITPHGRRLQTCAFLVTTKCLPSRFSTMKYSHGGVEWSPQRALSPQLGRAPPSALPRTSHPNRRSWPAPSGSSEEGEWQLRGSAGRDMVPARGYGVRDTNSAWGPGLSGEGGSWRPPSASMVTPP